MRPKLHILAIVLVLGTIARAQAVSIQLDSGTFRVTGWQAPATPPAGGWTSVFNVYAGTADAPAMLGSYFVEGGKSMKHAAFDEAWIKAGDSK